MRLPFKSLLSIAAVFGLLAPLQLGSPSAWAATAGTAVAALPEAGSARVIVQFKSNASVLRRSALALPSGASPLAQAVALHAARAAALGERVGLPLVAGSGVDERTQVMKASGMSSQQLAARLAQDADVAYAVVDERRRAIAVPNDPLYLTGPALGTTTGGPVAGQWYLRAPDATVKSSIDIETAWAVTPGSAGIVVAVLDTGLRFDHLDLQAGNVLPGYDFISTNFISNDGDGRDADASDPGDWVTQADVSSSANTIGCTSDDISASSWHGTQTLGLIGAAANNGIGMAGIGRGNVRMLPVRVLGKCGGFDSDIIAGMRWAAGLAVAGVPANANPARVINLSLGGTGSCSAAYRQAVADINAAGAVVVASAGNSTGHAVGTPANCTGVIAVAGLRHVGTKVGFSDLGSEIALSAPAGNCVNTSTGSPCLYPMLSLSNTGRTTPVSATAGGSLYTDSFDPTLGTSFSAPMVSGTVALMLSLQPGLTPAQVKQTLQQTARPFPTTGGDNGDGSVVTTCTAPQVDSAGKAVDQLQCYCTTSTCGAGMLDAGAAVKALALPGTASIAVTSGSAVAGQALALSAAGSTPGSGRTLAAYQWRLVDGGGIVTGFASATNAVTTTLVPSAAGRFTVGVTVTDSAGASVDTTLAISVAAAPTPTTPTTPAATTSSGGGGGALGLPWLLLLALAAVAAHRARRPH